MFSETPKSISVEAWDPAGVFDGSGLNGKRSGKSVGCRGEHASTAIMYGLGFRAKPFNATPNGLPVDLWATAEEAREMLVPPGFSDLGLRA